jgi:hypothetical protein
MLKTIFSCFQVERNSFDIKNARKTFMFGYSQNGLVPVDFQWPMKSEDIQASIDGSPVRVVAIDWLLCKQYINIHGQVVPSNNYLSALQLILSNG